MKVWKELTMENKKELVLESEWLRMQGEIENRPQCVVQSYQVAQKHRLLMFRLKAALSLCVHFGDDSYLKAVLEKNSETSVILERERGQVEVHSQALAVLLRSQ